MIRRITLGILGLCLLFGCAPKESKISTPDETDKKFVQILENDYGYAPVVRWVNQTLWVYLPAENDIYAVSAGQKPSGPVKRKFTLQYIAGEFKDKVFSLEYDVVPATKVDPGNGISTKYSPLFNEQYRNITTAISRSFFNATEPPQFIVTVIADIKNGLEVKNHLYLLDLIKYYSSALPPDEYGLRIQTATEGNPEIVDDKKGKHLQFEEILWPDFLLSQMVQRCKFKFQQSEFPPDQTPQDEILKQAVLTLQSYDFNDYTSVVLKDLREGTTTTFSKAEIDALKDPVLAKQLEAKPQGQIITIDFSDLWKKSEGSSEETK